MNAFESIAVLLVLVAFFGAVLYASWRSHVWLSRWMDRHL